MTLDLALSVARSGLRLLDRQMARTADDIANAGTEGHTRKIVQGTALSANGVGTGAAWAICAAGMALGLLATRRLARELRPQRADAPALASWGYFGSAAANDAAKGVGEPVDHVGEGSPTA